MNRILLLFATLFVFGLQAISAQDDPLTIETGHPDLSVKIKRCVASGKTIIIDAILKNMGDSEKNIEIWTMQTGNMEPHSSAYDDEGNTCQPCKNGKNIWVAVGRIPSDGDWKTGSFKLIPNIPTKVSFKIVGMPNSAQYLSLFDFDVRGDYNLDERVKMTNIPISRD